jgi:hypothetical protein
MGGAGSQLYVQFRMFSCEAYNILRKSADLILSLLHLMAGASIESIRQVGGGWGWGGCVARSVARSAVRCVLRLGLSCIVAATGTESIRVARCAAVWRAVHGVQFGAQYGHLHVGVWGVRRCVDYSAC